MRVVGLARARRRWSARLDAEALQVLSRSQGFDARSDRTICFAHKTYSLLLGGKGSAQDHSKRQGKMLVKRLKIRNRKFHNLSNNFVFFYCVLLGAILSILWTVGTLHIKWP